MQPKIDIVITRHRPLVALLIERGIITAETPVLEHAAISDVAGKHVLGVLPHWLSSKAASVTEVPMQGLTQADREAMTRGDLSLERTREVAGDPVTYYVTTERPWNVTRCFAAAARGAAPWSTFHATTLAQGVLELVSAEGSDWAQVDLYRDRYRTRPMGAPWSVWLDADGAAHTDQSDPTALGRHVWLRDTIALYDAPTGSTVEIWATGESLTDAPERYTVIGVERSRVAFAQSDVMRLRPEGNRAERDRLLPLNTPCRVIDPDERRALREAFRAGHEHAICSCSEASIDSLLEAVRLLRVGQTDDARAELRRALG